MPRKLLFSVNASDCDWSYTRGTGKGGQKRNKTSSAVHCMHRPSGAHGYADDTRSQHENRQLAFLRMAQSHEFQAWNRLEVAKVTGELVALERKVNEEMRFVKVEVQKDGKWIGVAMDDLEEEPCE